MPSSLPSNDSHTTLSSLLRAYPLFPRSRFTSLYSDFRPLRTINPDGYFANVSAWESFLRDATRHGLTSPSHDTLVLTTSTLLLGELATEEEGRPLAIGAVVTESLTTKALIPLTTFLTQPDSIYTQSWASTITNFVWSRIPIVGETAAPVDDSREGTLKTAQYVVVKNVEEAARAVVKQQAERRSGRVSDVWTIEGFAEEFMNPFGKGRFTDNDLMVILKYLERDAKEISVSGNTIKFKPPTSPRPTLITATDTTLASLKHTISITHVSLTALTTHSTALSTRAKSFLVCNNRPAALSALRTKKLVEQHIETRAASLAQLEGVLYQLEQAADNATLIRLLSEGGKALKEMNQEVGGVEKVEEVMEQLREAGEDAEEMNRVMNREGLVSEHVDEGEVEEELEELLREEEQRREREEYVKRTKEAEERARKEAEELARSLEGLEIIQNGVGEKQEGREGERERERAY
ncbi:Snf7-domain-containing protein [Kalaharituber pfeilii]|nr:Snf7-domain-containing protein [Kalaharituber pfeilii]